MARLRSSSKSPSAASRSLRSSKLLVQRADALGLHEVGVELDAPLRLVEADVPMDQHAERRAASSWAPRLLPRNITQRSWPASSLSVK